MDNKDWEYGKQVFTALKSCVLLSPTEAVNCLTDNDARKAKLYIDSQVILLKGDKRLKRFLDKRMKGEQ